MSRLNNEHFEIWGKDLEMPLIEDCGYNEWHTAEPLSWHWHEGYELVFLLEGSASFEFSDGSAYDLVGGEFFFKLPLQTHRAANDVTSPCKMCWIVFNPELAEAEKNTSFSKADLELLAEHYRQYQRQVFTFPNALRPVLENFRLATLDLHSEYRIGNTPVVDSQRCEPGRSAVFLEAEPFRVALIRSYLCQILLETVRLAGMREAKKPDEFVAAAIAYMEEHYQDDLSVDHIAEQLGLSRSYLYTIFREGTGQTPNDYLQRMRVRMAQLLLSSSSASITEIASSVGFGSSQYFSRVFRKYTHQTPQEYRKLGCR